MLSTGLFSSVFVGALTNPGSRKLPQSLIRKIPGIFRELFASLLRPHYGSQLQERVRARIKKMAATREGPMPGRESTWKSEQLTRICSAGQSVTLPAYPLRL